jgi:hypothetical protein
VPKLLHFKSRRSKKIYRKKRDVFALLQITIVTLQSTPQPTWLLSTSRFAAIIAANKDIIRIVCSCIRVRVCWCACHYCVSHDYDERSRDDFQANARWSGDTARRKFDQQNGDHYNWSWCRLFDTSRRYRFESCNIYLRNEKQLVTTLSSLLSSFFVSTWWRIPTLILAELNVFNGILAPIASSLELTCLEWFQPFDI